MKVGIDARSATLHNGSGIGTYTKNLVFNLSHILKKDLNIFWTGNVPKELIENNNNIFCCSGKCGGFYEQNFFPNTILENSIDLYHIPQNGIGLPLEWDINTVVTIHDLIPYVLPETVGKGYLERFLKDMPYIIEKAKGILTVSDFSKNDILRFFPNCPSEKIFVIPLASNSNFKPLSKDSCKEFIKTHYKIESPFILYLGGFSSRKNVKKLILAFNKIKKDLNTSHKLVLGGSLKDEGLKLKDLTDLLGLSNDVIFTGYLDDNILPLFYSASEAFVYPSIYEGFGLPPLEAMSCKTPVITSNCTSIPEVTSDCAILINPNNIDELAYCIKSLLNNDSLKDEYIEKGYERSLQFSWNNTSNITLKAYNSISNLIN